MITAIDLPDYLDAMHADLLDLSARIRDRLEPDLATVEVPIGADLLRLHDDGYLFIREGYYKYERKGRLLRVHSTGDIVHASRAEARDGATLRSEFPGTVEQIAKGDLIQFLGIDPGLALDWLAHRDLEGRIMAALAALFMGEEVRPEFELKRFASGELILREGEDPDAIYLLLEGEATASVDHFEVGRIGPHEAFGEISFLTDHPRTATVVAVSETCLCQRIGKADFLGMIRSKPQFITAIAKTLAGRIVKMNAKLVGSIT